VIKLKIEFDLPFMVLDLVYTFPMILLTGNLNYWAETKHVTWMDMVQNLMHSQLFLFLN